MDLYSMATAILEAADNESWREIESLESFSWGNNMTAKWHDAQAWWEAASFISDKANGWPSCPWTDANIIAHVERAAELRRQG